MLGPAADETPAGWQTGAMPKVAASDLARWRALECELILGALAEHAKSDRTYLPAKDIRSSRWHASVGGTEFELLLTGPKFWDCRALTGGGGAVDFVMHLVGADFRFACGILISKGL